jgi:hypothetical protein
MRTISVAMLCMSVFSAIAWARTADPVVLFTDDQSASQSAGKKHGKKQKPTGIGSDCTPTKRLPPLLMDATGNVSTKGKSIEGPVCIEVDYAPLQYRVSFARVETHTSGPDPSSVLLGGGKSGAKPPEKEAPEEEKSLSKTFSQIADSYYTGPTALIVSVEREPTEYATAMAAQANTIADIKALLNRLTGLSLKDQAAQVANAYQTTIGADIQNANAGIADFLPADQPPKKGNSGSLMLQLHALTDSLDRLGYEYPVGNKLPDKTTINCTGDTVTSDGKIIKVGWRDWYADSNCKQLFDTLKKGVGDAISAMQPYATFTENVNTLRAKAAIVDYWDRLFQAVGAAPGSVAVDFQKSGVARDEEPCGNIFNQNASRAISIVTVDESPTLDGNAPAVKTQDAFLTVTCASPIALSAGVAFSSIEQKEFAIIKSAGSTPAGPSVSEFGTLSDSAFHPMPAAFVHGRLLESADHQFGLHATLGISGNIQGQDSGGSNPEFLTGISFALWRTIYLTGGLHIGTKAELAGGFHEGDLVPSDITTIQGQVKRSYTAGFGFAFSFGKP